MFDKNKTYWSQGYIRVITLPWKTAQWNLLCADVIEVLKECNFSGYLSSEYEGNRHIQDAFEVDSVEQVRRQQEMFRRLFCCSC